MPGMTFDGTDDRITAASTPITAYGFSMFAAVNFASVTGERRIFGIYDTTLSGENQGSCFLRLSATPTIQARRNQADGLGAGATSTVTPTTGVWYRVGATFQSSTATSITVDGESLHTGAADDRTFASGINSVSIGATNNAAANKRYLLGQIAAPTIWNVVLTQAELDAITVWRYHPTRIRPEAIVFHGLSLFPTPVDIKGRALTLSGGGSAMTDGPPLTWR